MEATEWIEFTPDIIWTGSTAPTNDVKAYYRINDKGVLHIKLDDETQGCVKGFELKIYKNK